MDKIGGTIVTIDIGTSKVGLIVTKVNKFNKLEVVHVETKKCDAVIKGEIKEPYKIAELLKNSLAQIESRYGIKIKSSYANINNRYIDIDEIIQSIDVDQTFGFVQQYDVDRLLNKMKDIQVASNRKVIDVVPLEYYDENKNLIKSLENIKTNKLSLKAQIVVAQREYVEKIQSIFQYAGIKLDGLILQCISDAQLLLTPEQKYKGVLLIDVGANCSDISIYINDKIIYIDNIELGGQTLTSDLSIVLETSMEEAEKVKKQYSLAMSKFIENDYPISILDNDNKVKKVNCSEVVEIIEARCEQMLQLINEKIEEIDAKKYVQEVVITGLGFNTISKIDVLGHKIFQLPVNLVNFKQTNQIKPVNTTAYAMQEYVLSGKSRVNNKLSIVREVDETEKKGIFSRIFEKIQDFLYT